MTNGPQWRITLIYYNTWDCLMFIDLEKLCCNIHLFSWDLMKGDHDNTICVSGWEGYAKVMENQ